MDISVFLAKVLGSYLFLMAIVLYANMRRFKKMFNDADGAVLMFVSGAKSLLIGLLILACHNIWEANWKGLITFLGWAFLVRGLIRLFLPDFAFKKIRYVINTPNVFCSILLVVLVIGAYLGYIGYMT